MARAFAGLQAAELLDPDARWREVMVPRTGLLPAADWRFGVVG
jgi:hypothetical protein